MPLAALAGDKTCTRELFEAHGLPVAAGRTFSREEIGQAAAFGVSLGGRCVVKPAIDTGAGVGVSIGLRTPREIRRAFLLAAAYSREILLEAEAPGDSYRFLVFRGRCLSVIRRETPSVTGNGSDSVRRLVLDLNSERIKGPGWRYGDPFFMPVPAGRNASAVLDGQGLSWNSTPEPGRVVRLAAIANFRTGCTFSECIRAAHPAACETAIRATDALGLELAGVDLMLRDIASPSRHLLEINTTPYLPMHYLIRNPDECVDPIRAILTGYFGLAD